MTLTKISCLRSVIYAMTLIGIFTVKVNAQELPIEHYTSLDDIDPLPESPVLAAYQDSIGYLWIANYGFGLVRYDGQKMERYPGLDNALGMNVFALQEGPAGRLWALSADKGPAVSEHPLSAYEAGDTVQFSDSLGEIPLYRDRFDLFSSPFIKDTQGALWLGTTNGMILRYRYEASTGYKSDTLTTIMRSDSSYAPVRSMVSRQNGSVWVSIINDSLLVFEDEEQQTARMQEAPCTDITQLFEDSKATLWAGCTRGDVWRFIEGSNTWENLKPAQEGQAIITGLAEAAPGLLWATSLGQGIWEVNVETGNTTIYNRRNGLLDRNIWDVTTDLEGNVWVSQNTGLSKLRMNQAAFRAYTSRSYTGERPALVGAEALASEPDIAWPLSSGDTLHVLAAATSGGLSLIGADGRVEHLTTESGLTSDLMLDVCNDALGRLWIMTREGFDILSLDKPAPPMPNFARERSFKIFGKDATLTSYRIGMATECGTPPKITLPSEDSPADEAIVCFVKSQRPAVGCWAGDRWLFFDDGSGIPVEAFRTLDWDADGYLYAGATFSGLYRSTVPLSYAIPDTLVGSSETVVPFVRQPVFEQVLGNEGEPFAGTGITKVLRVGTSIWVQPSSAPTKIIRSDKPEVTGEIDFSGLNEYPNSLAYSPVTNTVWLSTDEGIFETDTLGVSTGRRADQSDGLLYHTASGPPALRVGTDGMIYHSSTAGITRYQPSRDRQNTTPPGLDFRSFRYSGDDAGSNELEITYAALSYTAERQVRYRTRLRGYDDTWSEPSSETRARYTNLSAFAVPRTYTFEVMAANNDGLWTTTPLTRDVRVQPAWWARWWALALYSTLFVGVAAGGERLQRKRLIEQERQNARERELEQARETERAYVQLEQSHQELKRTQNQLIQQEKLASLGQLTAGIAHEIKNPLNFVNNFSEVSVELIEEAREEIRRVKTDDRAEDGVLDGEEDETLATGLPFESSAQNNLLEILDDIEANLKTIHKHGSRADSIVKSMLQHSRGGDGKMEPTPFNPLIKEYVNLAFHGMRAGKDPIKVDIDLQIDENIGDIPLIAEDFSRVILNLCNNAFDALREKAKVKSDKGENFSPLLRVTTETEDGHVILMIEDNGPGIPDDIRDKILQPFFTTKKGTAGTGLGLSITNDIIKAHGGRLDVSSSPGEGSVFSIHLERGMQNGS